MKRLLEGIKDNENKTQVLSQSLMQFNESFKTLLQYLSEEEPMASLDKNGQKIKGLNDSVENISREIKESRSYQERRFDELASQMKYSGGNLESQGSETALYHKGKIYMISQDRVCVSRYDTLTASYEMIYGEEREIKAIFLYHEEFLLQHTDGKMSTLEGKDIGVEGIQRAVASDWGMLLLNKQKELTLYKNSKYSITLADHVEQFELMTGRYLFYQTAERQKDGLVIYKDNLKDLSISPIEESTASQLFAYGVDQVHDKVYTVEADGTIKEQTE